MGEVTGESSEEQIAKFDVTCAVAESQWEIAQDSYFWLDDGQASPFLRPGPLEVSFCQLIAEIGMALQRRHEINVARMCYVINELFFEAPDHVKTQLVIE